MNALIHMLQPLFGVLWPLVWSIVKIVAIVLPLMVCVAYLTLAERKVIGYMQGTYRPQPCGLRLVATYRRCAEAVDERSHHSHRSKQDFIPAGAGDVDRAGIGCLGSDTVQP